MAYRFDDLAVVTDSKNMVQILVNYYVFVFCAAEGRGFPSLAEPSVFMKAPHFTPAAMHKELSTLSTAMSRGPHQFHSFMLQFLADFLEEAI